MSDDRLTEQVAYEIRDLHDFFADWLSGSSEKGAADFEGRFAARMAEGFEIVSPDSNKSSLSELVDRLRGAHGSRPDIALEVRNVEARELSDNYIVATYEEWQQEGDGPPRGRLSSALLRRDLASISGFLWLHVHETWVGSD